MRHHLRALLSLSALPLLACAVDATPGPAPEEVSSTSQALSYIPDPGWMYPVSYTAAPSNFGTYCSVIDQPKDGAWAFTWRAPGAGDPCQAMASGVGPTTVVQRAGLYNESGYNNAMVRCDGILEYGTAYGESALSNISAAASGGRNCIFIISPVSMNVWGPPYDTSATVSGTSVFDYNVSHTPWSTAPFGTPGDFNACAVDREGYELHTCGPGGSLGPPPAYPPPPAVYDAVEPAYDWSLPRDTPILAVADGYVRWSGGRHVSDSGCHQAIPGSDQQELYLETQVGNDEYSEHFIAAYHHMDANPSGAVAQALVQQWGGPMVPSYTYVTKGQILGFVGESGCAGGYHVDFMAFRLTNLTGARSYVFEPTTTDTNLGGSGVNGWQGVMDPFGWGAPQGVDPMAYKYIGQQSTDQPASIVDMGTFSIKMWDVWPTSYVLPHNGSYRYY